MFNSLSFCLYLLALSYAWCKAVQVYSRLSLMQMSFSIPVPMLFEQQMHLSPSECPWVCWSLNEIRSGALLAHCFPKAVESNCTTDLQKALIAYGKQLLLKAACWLWNRLWFWVTRILGCPPSLLSAWSNMAVLKVWQKFTSGTLGGTLRHPTVSPFKMVIHIFPVPIPIHDWRYRYKFRYNIYIFSLLLA